ncbi:hypothetical protein O181_014728 [Austropuccinia psidii MF-1]|uniref:Uncharacterized protein n=1 Tax=Austropuccinia psidii MF-1 TaxID=1389203 RepID=A0A9Q3GPA5_9BASI|nr:hypothetical protein [Austropuccinia psidii MF-1]
MTTTQKSKATTLSDPSKDLHRDHHRSIIQKPAKRGPGQANHDSKQSNPSKPTSRNRTSPLVVIPKIKKSERPACMVVVPQLTNQKDKVNLSKNPKIEAKSLSNQASTKNWVDSQNQNEFSLDQLQPPDSPFSFNKSKHARSFKPVVIIKQNQPSIQDFINQNDHLQSANADSSKKPLKTNPPISSKPSSRSQSTLEYLEPIHSPGKNLSRQSSLELTLDHLDSKQIPFGQDGLPIPTQNRPAYINSYEPDPFGFENAEKLLKKLRTQQRPNQPSTSVSAHLAKAGSSTDQNTARQTTKTTLESDLSLTDLLKIPKRKAFNPTLFKNKKIAKAMKRQEQTPHASSESSSEKTSKPNQKTEKLTKKPKRNDGNFRRVTSSIQVSQLTNVNKLSKHSHDINQHSDSVRKPLSLKRIDLNQLKNNQIQQPKSKKRAIDQGLDANKEITPERKKRIQYYDELQDLQFEEEIVL